MNYQNKSQVNVLGNLPAAKYKSPCPCGGPSKADCKCDDKHHDHPHHDHSPAKPSSTEPDFAHMTPAEKLAWNKANRDRIFGSSRY